MAMNVYGLKNCDTCRKVKKALDAANVQYKFHDVRDDGIAKAQVVRWSKAVGWEKLLNKSSTTWRQLPESEKRDLDQSQAVCLMADHPTLMKRPIIENGPTAVYVGWSKDVQEKVLK